jgi:hypothetical protein
MDQHQGDLAGFAKLHGYLSVKPEPRQGQAVLLITTPNAPQKPPHPPSRAGQRNESSPRKPKRRR